MTWQASDLRQNQKKPSIIERAESNPPPAPSPERTPRLELAEQAELWMAEEQAEQFPMFLKRELAEAGLMDERMLKFRHFLLTRGIVDL